MEQEIDFFIETENQKVPQLSPDKKFYIIYSPTKFKLRPCESIMLNLYLKKKIARLNRRSYWARTIINSTKNYHRKLQTFNARKTK